MRLRVESWKNTLAKLGFRRGRSLKHRASPRARSLQAEPLEERRLLNVDLGTEVVGLLEVPETELGSLAGVKFEDINGDGVRDAGEPPLEGVTIYLDLNDNGVVDAGGEVEPDDYPPGSVVNTVDPGVALSVLGSGNQPIGFPVTATTDNLGFASTGSLVFGHANVGFFNSGRRLGMEFTNPVDRVSIDFAGGNTVGVEVGRLEIYDAQDALLDTYLTQPLSGGQVETMAISRPTADIARAIAYTQPGQGNFGRLDNLVFGAGEPSVETDANGGYQFTDLPPGEYVVREVVPDDYRATTPVVSAARLFATSIASNEIVELDPAGGSEINRFPAPTSMGTSFHGLAYANGTVYFVTNLNDVLYELDPDSGAVRDATPLPGGNYDGVAVLDGLVYIADFAANRIQVFDPELNLAMHTVVAQTDLIGGLGELPETGQLVATTGGSQVVLLDPVSGAVTSVFPNVIPTPDSGVTSVNGEIYVGFNDGRIQVYHDSGAPLRTIHAGFQVYGLGGASAAEDAYRVTLGPGEDLEGLDFGNQYLLGDIQGTKFEDLDGDGVRDAGEPPMEGVTIYLDLNDNGILDVATAEPSVETDANGGYQFTDLPAGDYVVREVVPDGYAQTTPAVRPARLFATDVATRPYQILELDPADGSLRNQFATPNDSSTNGLAFDGQTLYFVSAGPPMIFELDPDTGAVMESTPLPSGRLDGVAVLDGLVYILDGDVDDIHVYDPQANAIINTIDVNVTDSSLNLIDSLAESDGHLVAGTVSGRLANIDPATGDVTAGIDVAAGPPDTALTGFADEIYVGYIHPPVGIRVYNLDGVLQRTLPVNTRVTGLGGVAGVVDDAHRVTLQPSETITGLDFGNQYQLGDLTGTKFEDLDGDGVRDAGEPPLAGVTIYLDLNDNGVYEVGGALEPDDYGNGQPINTVQPDVTLTAMLSSGGLYQGGQVRALNNPYASTGTNVIGNLFPSWTSGRELLMEFTQPVSSVSIDFISDWPPGTSGRLEVYDASDNLLGSYDTSTLARGEVETMTVVLSTVDIAYATARSLSAPALLDNLQFGDAEPSVTVDATGEYAFTDLPPGDYVVREVVPQGYAQTTPAPRPTRLFATDVETRPYQILELDPADGSLRNQFATPNDSSTNGLAFDGQTLYFVSAGPPMIFELDPETGAVLDSTPLPSGRLDGVAVLDGLVYVLDGNIDDIHVYDPQANAIINTIDVNVTDSSLNLLDSLGESDGHLVAGTVSGRLANIDPATGDATAGIDVAAGPPDTAVTGFAGEIYVGYIHPPVGIRVYNLDGVLQRTLPVNTRVTGLGGAAGMVDDAHHVTLHPSETITGLDFGNQLQLGEIRGAKFEDLDGDGVRDAGEPPMEGVTIYLDLNDNGVFDAGGGVEPDDYAPASVINTASPEITLSVLGGTGNTLSFPVTATTDNLGFAPTGSLVFGHANVGFFNNTRRLGMEFANPVDWVSIDFAGGNTVLTEVGRLEVYDAQGGLLDTYLTQPLNGGQVETMAISRPAADIASAVAYTQPGQGNFGRLDNLVLGAGEPFAETDAGGQYQFGDLPPGDYVVREVVPADYAQTFPFAAPGRLFAPNRNGSPDNIVELDPQSGAIINQFAAPVSSVGSASGLAFDGSTLYFLTTSGSTLYELDPNDGTVLDATVLPSTLYEGLATLDGLVYILNSADDVSIFDPQSNAIIGTLDINAINPGVSLYGALGEIEDPSALLATTGPNTVVFIDPATGLITDSFNHTGPLDFGVTSVDGEIYVGFTDGKVQVFDRGGNLVRSFGAPFPVYALGGSSTTDDAHQVSLGPGEVLDGFDFGNQYLLGEIQGTKFEDLDGDGVRDVGEPPFEGVTIYLDLNDNGTFDGGNVLEPDDYASGTLLNTVNPGVTLSSLDRFGNPVGGNRVQVYSSSYASTGLRIIGNVTPTWYADNRFLKMEFTDSVSAVSIDYSSVGPGTTGRLEIYDSNDTLLDTYLTANLPVGQFETMTIARSVPDIAYAVATPDTTFGTFDHLVFDVEPSATTDVNGEYAFTELPPGDYVVREVVPDGYEQTYPRIGGPHRLFAVPRTGDDIVELDPQSGAEINRFAAPFPTSGGPDGLAFDGESLWYINGFGDDTLYQLNPDTGAVIDADPITAGSRAYDGLAALNGSIYILDFGQDDIFEFDPVSDTITNSFHLGGVGGGLAGITQPERLVTKQGGQVVEIDPANGAVTNSFSGPGGLGFAVVDGQIYIAGAGPQISVLDRTGSLVRTIVTPVPSSALGGDDVGGGDGSHRVTVSASSVFTLDFGNERFIPPPTADAGGPYTVPEGGSVTLDGSASSDPAGGPLTYEWDLDGDGQFGETGPAAEQGDEVGVNPVFSAAGLDGPLTDTVALRVTNEFGKTDDDTASIDVTNVAPQIQLIRLSQLEIDENETVQLTVEFSDPGTPDTHRVAVRFGTGGPDSYVYLTDGSRTATVTSRRYIDDNPSGTPSDPYTIQVTVTDDENVGDSQTTSVVVNNVAPTLTNVAVTPAIDENGVVTLSGEIIDPAGNSTATLIGLDTVDAMIDGIADSFTATGQIDQADIRDNTGGDTWHYDNPVPGGGGDNYAVVGTGTLFVNTPGTFSFAIRGDDGGRLRIDGVDVIADDRAHPPTTAYGDASLAAGEHTFEWVGFERGGGAGWELSVAVGGGKTSPVNSPNGWQVVGDPAPLPEIQLLGPIDVTAFYAIGPTVERFTLTVGWGDGSTQVINLGNQKQFSIDHPYADDDPTGTPSDIYAISLLVRDDDTGEGTAATSVTVNNVAPVIDPADLQLSAPEIDENGIVTLTGSFTDVGTEDSHEVTIAWGDGTSSPATVTQGAGSGTFTATHQYWDDNPSGTPSDVYTITATVTDDDTGSGSATTSVTVNNVAPQLTGLYINSPITENGTTRLVGFLSDPAQRDLGEVRNLATVDAMIAGDRRVTTATAQIDQADIYDRFSPGRWLFNNPVPGGGGDNYAVVSTGTIEVNAPGTFSFAITSDDGGRLRIDGIDVIVDDANHPPFDRYGDATLSAGPHTFEWVGFESTGGSSWELSVAVGGGNRSRVSAASGWKVLGDPAPFAQIALAGPIDVTAYYLNEDPTETFTATIDWGDGTTQVVSVGYRDNFGVDHQYLDDDPSGTPSDTYPITVTVRDDDSGISDPRTTSVTVLNDAPEVMIELDQQVIDENDTVTLTGTIVDVGTQDTYTATIDWGDGTTTNLTSGLGSRYVVLGGYLTWTQAEATAVAMGGHLVAINSQAENDLVQDMVFRTFGYDAPTWIGMTDSEAYGGTEFGNTSNQPNQGAGFVWTTGDPVTFMNWRDGEPNNLAGTEDYVAMNHQASPSQGGGKWGDRWNVPNVRGAVVELDSPSLSVTHTYLDDNPTGTPIDTYTIDVTVTDDDTGQGTASTTLTVGNIAPTLANLTATPILENGVTTLSGTIGDVGTLDTFTVAIDWDADGHVDETHTGLSAGAFSYTHQYLDDQPTGTPVDQMPIAVTVTDDDTGTAAAGTTVEVTNVAPTLTDLGATPILENGVTTLSGTIGDVGTLDTFTIEIDWDANGVVDETHTGLSAGAFSYTHQYLDDQPTGTPVDQMPIGVTVTDDDTGTVSAGTTVEVTNVAPTLTDLGATPILENGVTTLSGTIGDVGTLDTFTVAIDWDADGQVDETHTGLSAGAFSYTHQYLDDQPTGTPVDQMPIGVAVTDDDTGTVLTGTTVEVTNVAPAIVELSNSSPSCGGAAHGETITLAGAFTDVGTLDTHTATVNWGDQTESTADVSEAGGSGSVSASHVYASGGVYTITVTISDDDTGHATETSTSVIVGVGLNDGQLQVVGTAGKDDIDIKLGSDGGSDSPLIKVKAKLNKGSDGGSDNDIDFNAPASDVDSILILLCDGDDKAKIHNKLDIDATIYGGAGDDKLTGGAGDDVIYGEAGDDDIKGGDGDDQVFAGDGDDKLTGDGGSDLLDGGAGDDDLKGGSDAGSDGSPDIGGDILLGGAGDDKLDGGKGRDLLIGGTGEDDLKGDKEDDILIGGFTEHDQDLAALEAMLAEWTSAGDYEDRIANLNGSTGGSGANGSYYLIAGDPSDTAVTVWDDRVEDTLKGQKGLDWFFADLDGADGDDDKVKDDTGDEIIDLIYDLP